MAKTRNAYQKTNLIILWFLNITEYQWYIILSCFIYKIIFDNRLECNNYYDNYIYNKAEARQLPELDGYNIIARLNMIYECRIEYSNILLFNKRDRLLAANLIKNPKTRVK